MRVKRCISKNINYTLMNLILETICNPGLRERHWDQMGTELGFEVKHGPDMTLSSMIDAGIIIKSTKQL